MFSKAVPIAAGFTRPVVISSRTMQGACAGTIGAYVVVNPGGWILTAGHLLDIVRKQQGQRPAPCGVPGQRRRVPPRHRCRQALSQERGAHLPQAG